jgi:hypothetical protein
MFLNRSNETATAIHLKIFQLQLVNYHIKKALVMTVYEDIINPISKYKQLKGITAKLNLEN